MDEAEGLSEALLPCPFCGGDADFCETGVWWLRCTGCHADGPSAGKKAAAIAAWNARAESRSTPDGEGVALAATQATLGRGVVDIGPFEFGDRRGVLIRPRPQHIPYGDPGELQNVVYWPKAGDIVLWVEGSGPGVLIESLSAFLARPASSAGGDEKPDLFIQGWMTDRANAGWRTDPETGAVVPPVSAGGVEEALRAAVIHAARKMPRRTPASGGGSTVHTFEIEAGVVWELDGALTNLDRAISKGAERG